MAAMPANSSTVTNYYNQSVYDPAGTKVGDVSDRDALVLSGNASFAEEVVVADSPRHGGPLPEPVLDQRG